MQIRGSEYEGRNEFGENTESKIHWKLRIARRFIHKGESEKIYPPPLKRWRENVETAKPP